MTQINNKDILQEQAKKEENNNAIKLLDDKFQKKLIKVLIEDNRFANDIIDIIKIDFFEGLFPITIIKYILDYFERFGNVPNYDTLEDIIRINETDEPTKTHLLEFIKITKEYKLVDKNHVINYTIDFCRKQSLKRGLEKASQEIDNLNYDGILKIINDSIKVGSGKELGHNYLKDVEKRLVKAVRSPVPFLNGFDEKISGGLAPGELGIILAATGGGKSMMLVKGASTAMLNGKTIFYYTMELAETIIANRFDSCFTGHKLNAILNYPQSIRQKAQEIEMVGGNLVIKEFPTGTATVNSLRSHIKQQERDGLIPDEIFVDYADIMKPTATFQEKRFALTNIYEGLRALAMELSVPIWTASQASRAAINESKFDLKVISESLGKAQTADVILGLGRSDDDKSHRRAQLIVLKNRNGEDGYSIPLHFDTSNIDIYLSQAEIHTGVEGLGDTIENAIRQNKQAFIQAPDDNDDGLLEYNNEPQL